ncbi:MAG: chemotaxis protein CheW, partial [Gemmatimonadales bacterium]
AGVVREVVRAVAIAALPKAPPIVEGIINFRGALVPVLDIRQRFRLPPAPLAPEQHLIIAKTDSRLVALRVDRALDLVVVDQDAIESAARVAPGTEYVAGIAKLTDGLLVIHDLESFLSFEEAGQVDAAVVGLMAAGKPGEQRTGASSPQRKAKW